MVREIVSILLGTTGNKIGAQFLNGLDHDYNLNIQSSLRESLNSPDKISANDKYLLHVYYDENKESLYHPRAVFADTQTLTSEYFNANNLCCLLPDNQIYGDSEQGTNKNWGIGYYSDDLFMQLVESIRREVEKCDCIQGFQMFNSLGGGTGSGIGSRTIEFLKDEYPDTMISSNVVFPDLDSVGGIYNCVLGLENLINFSNEVFSFDNDSLTECCQKNQHLSTPSYGDLNHVIGAVLTVTSFSLLSNEQSLSTMRKRINSLVPFSKMHFYSSKISPCISRGTCLYCVPSLE
ncbi:beta-tubulin 2 [Tritrichomonas foetus]|uniref:Tubulin beta chain n=1 Tax=Tritrichomonas foetus TaxID=1144522 RepID=A0A1J4KL02_9EUKA|nr:beta-tubulin 2 [Tritrichomonas foetus]|eukprot:OHT10053.1 beta-tubulin 2 [Tritrichomonas foetus]